MICPKHNVNSEYFSIHKQPIIAEEMRYNLVDYIECIRFACW